MKKLCKIEIYRIHKILVLLIIMVGILSVFSRELLGYFSNNNQFFLVVLIEKFKSPDFIFVIKNFFKLDNIITLFGLLLNTLLPLFILKPFFLKKNISNINKILILLFYFLYGFFFFRDMYNFAHSNQIGGYTRDIFIIAFWSINALFYNYKLIIIPIILLLSKK